MKILHLDSGREWRGGQQQLLYLLDFLAANGCETAAACRAESPLHVRLQRAGIPCFPWLAQGEWPLKSMLRLNKIAAAYTPDIIHCHDARSILPGLWTGHLLQRQTVIAHRRVDFPVSATAVFLKYRRLDRTIAVSQMIKNLLVAAGLNENKISVVHDGIDCDRFMKKRDAAPMRAMLGIPPNAIHVGNAGSLVDHKGQIYLLAAAAALVPAFPQLYFSIAGEGPLRPGLQKKISELKLNAHFKLPGFISDMPSYFHSLDIYAHPSKTEGMGSAIIEAMACGIPVIAARSGGIPEIVGDHGRLVKAKDGDALAAGLKAMVSSPALLEELAARSLKRSGDFDFHSTNKALLAIYQRLLES